MRYSPFISLLLKPIADILLHALLLFTVLTPVCADVNLGREAYAMADYREALRYFSLPAERGDAEAQLYMGLMYRGGEGVAVDHKRAVDWYRRAAEQGHPRGQTNLAIGYALGRGVERDSQQALHWYLRAARQGYNDAQVRLGQLYSGGHGIAADPVRAYAWYSMALRDTITCECIRGYRDELAARMSTTQISEAESLFEQWSRQIDNGVVGQRVLE